MNNPDLRASPKLDPSRTQEADQLPLSALANPESQLNWKIEHPTLK
jgi:hypothetical protein